MSDPLLFVVDTLLEGEPEHALLARAIAKGRAKTVTGYGLADLGATGALVDGGAGAVLGELYAVARADLAAIDVKRGHPLVHQRRAVRLEGGVEAEAYFLSMEQARGVRRVRSGDWRARFTAARSVEPSALVAWAKRRHER